MHIEDFKEKIKGVTSKEEFYDFIRELNDELRKLEKNIVTHDSLDRLKSNLNLKLKELKQDLSQKKKVSENLNKVKKIEDKVENIESDIKDLNKLFDETENIKTKLEKTKKNFVNWQEFFDKVKEITKEDNDKAIKNLKQEYEEEFENIYDTIDDVKEKSTLYNEFKKANKKLLSKLKAEKIERKKIMQKFKEQNKEIKELKKNIKLNKKPKEKKKEKNPNLFWPISFLTLIILALIVGMIFWGPSLMNPNTYANPEDLQCQEKFECKNLNDSMYLVNCSFDSSLNDCHCSVIKNPNKCLK